MGRKWGVRIGEDGVVEGRKMRVVVAGAGNAGRSVARELLDNGHKVLLIEQLYRRYEPQTVPDADWLLADACELSAMEEAGIETADVLIAATGDDKSNLVVGLLAKSEFGVPRVVARINDIRNQWLFGQDWGIDVAVSTPGALVAGIEGAIDVGHLVRLMTLRGGRVELTKLTLPQDNPVVGQRVDRLELPADTALVTVVRGNKVRFPKPDDVLEAGDELLFTANRTSEHSLLAAIHGGEFLREVVSEEP